MLTPGEALLDEMSVERPIPDAAGVTLPVERRLEAPDVRYSTMVPSAESLAEVEDGTAVDSPFK